MSFMEGILKQNMPVWDKCIATLFVQDMKDGKLPIEDFKEYMIQDSIYLKNYARVYGKAIYHAETLREIQLYYSILNFVTDAESVVRLNYLRQFVYCKLNNCYEPNRGYRKMTFMYNILLRILVRHSNIL